MIFLTGSHRTGQMYGVIYCVTTPPARGVAPQ